MRDTDPKELTPTLGKKIEKPAMPEPHKKVADGVFKSPDGKLYTAKPENEMARQWHWFIP